MITSTKASNPIPLRMEYSNFSLPRSTHRDSKLRNHWWRFSFHTASTHSGLEAFGRHYGPWVMFNPNSSNVSTNAAIFVPIPLPNFGSCPRVAGGQWRQRPIINGGSLR